MKLMHREDHCAYCTDGRAETVDHVVPKALYPKSKVNSRVQRITVPACRQCNNGWSDNEAHFRNMLLISGDKAPIVQELWEGKVRRSFSIADGRKRVHDLFAQMVPIQTPAGERHMVYPGRDLRVMMVVRKVIRGLSHHHKLLSPVLDDQVWADIQQFLVPPELIMDVTLAHVEEDVLWYQYLLLDEPDIHSFWSLRFFDRTPFYGFVYQSVEARKRFDTASSTINDNVSGPIASENEKSSMQKA